MSLGIIVLLLQLLFGVISAWKIPRNAVCEGSTLTLTCPQDQEIHITSANYGRLIPSAVFCPYYRQHDDRTDCMESESKSKVQNKCDGEQTCTVRASNGVFGDPCVNTYKYLQVEYDCVKRVSNGLSYKIPRNSVCEHSTLTITCPQEQKIHITNANYGRLIPSSVFCPYRTTHDDRTDCVSSNSMSVVQKKCDGQQTCSISASNSVFGDPCINTYKYLTVDYDCVTDPVGPKNFDIPDNAVCENSDLTITCPMDNKIKITHANYGRLIPSTVFCPYSDYHEDRTDCISRNSQSIVESWCNGRQTCTVSASNDIFGDPCFNTYKYLQVEFDCVTDLDAGHIGMWGPWIGCSRTCGTGSRSRTRSCISDTPSGGGIVCDGVITTQTASCELPACPPSVDNSAEHFSHEHKHEHGHEHGHKHGHGHSLMWILLCITAFLSGVIITIIATCWIKRKRKNDGPSLDTEPPSDPPPYTEQPIGFTNGIYDVEIIGDKKCDIVKE